MLKNISCAVFMVPCEGVSVYRWVEDDVMAISHHFDGYHVLPPNWTLD